MDSLFNQDGKSSEDAILDGYCGLQVLEENCTPVMAEDLRGILAARWLAEMLSNDFETAAFGARIYGSLGNYDGVVADSMPGYWRRTGELASGKPIWQADARHPLGKWMADIAARLLPVPPPEIIHGVLRRHGIEGSRYPAPQMTEIDGGWAILLHGARNYRDVPGLRRDDSLMALFTHVPGPPLRHKEK